MSLLDGIACFGFIWRFFLRTGCVPSSPLASRLHTHSHHDLLINPLLVHRPRSAAVTLNSQ